MFVDLPQKPNFAPFGGDFLATAEHRLVHFRFQCYSRSTDWPCHLDKYGNSSLYDNNYSISAS